MTDHEELLWRRAATLRAAQRRADEAAAELAAAARAAYNDDNPQSRMRPSAILRSIGHIWSRTWLDKILKEEVKVEDRPVVLAIITSDRGVLVGKRNDGTPPWTFPGGELGRGESPITTAVREIREETGLAIEPVGYEIGRRVHPATGRSMIYLACTSANGMDAVLGDRDELAEVRWADLAEAEILMPDMYEPVRDYLRRELRS